MRAWHRGRASSRSARGSRAPARTTRRGRAGRRDDRGRAAEVPLLGGLEEEKRARNEHRHRVLKLLEERERRPRIRDVHDRPESAKVGGAAVPARVGGDASALADGGEVEEHGVVVVRRNEDRALPGDLARDECRHLLRQPPAGGLDHPIAEVDSAGASMMRLEGREQDDADARVRDRSPDLVVVRRVGEAAVVRRLVPVVEPVADPDCEPAAKLVEVPKDDPGERAGIGDEDDVGVEETIAPT